MLDIGFATLYEIVTNDDGELSRIFVDSDSRTLIFDNNDRLTRFLTTSQSYEGLSGRCSRQQYRYSSKPFCPGSSGVPREYFLYDAEKKSVSFLIGATN